MNTKELIETLRDEAKMDNGDYYDEDYRKLSADSLEQLQQRNAELERERDELAAHLEKADRCIEYTSTYLNEDKLNAIGSGSKAHQEMRDYLYKVPKQSLAEHDAEVASKAWIQGYFHRSTHGAQHEEVVMSAVSNYVDRNYGVKGGE